MLAALDENDGGNRSPLHPITQSGTLVTMEGNTVMSTMAIIMQTKKGKVTRAMQLLSSPVMFCSTKRLKPTGGVGFGHAPIAATGLMPSRSGLRYAVNIKACNIKQP